MPLKWEDRAIKDRIDIFEFLYEFNPLAAEKTDLIIKSRAETLLTQPLMGVQKINRRGRCLIIPEISMLLAYSYDETTNFVYILRVLHQKQKQPHLSTK